MIFGRPTEAMIEAYTRVLQGHVSPRLSTDREMTHGIVQIAIDSAIFPEGTNGKQLDVLARKALWKEGLNYMVNWFILVIIHEDVPLMSPLILISTAPDMVSAPFSTCMKVRTAFPVKLR